MKLGSVVAGVLLGLIGLNLLLGCRKQSASRPQPQPVPVRVQIIEAKPHIAAEDVVGTVRPKLHSVIEAKVSGRIGKMLVTPGQQVKAGELLAELDVREIQAKLDQAFAVRQQAENDLKRSESLRSRQRWRSSIQALSRTAR